MKRTRLTEGLRNILKKRAAFLTLCLIITLGLGGFCAAQFAQSSMKDAGKAFFERSAFKDFDMFCSVGIDRDAAMNLICATLEGSAAMLRDSGDTADRLIEKVSSKGGTTIAALEQLRSRGFTEALTEAMKACTNRAEELGK